MLTGRTILASWELLALSSTKTINVLGSTTTITVAASAYEPTEEWPSPYNGVTADSFFGLAFNRELPTRVF